MPTVPDIHRRGTRAAQATLGTPLTIGTLYFVTDEGLTERWTGSAWESYSGPAAGTTPPSAHHTTHQPGGSDPIAALDASVITTGTIAPARLPAVAPSAPAAHAATHAAAGSDPVSVTGLAGFPGGATDFLRADATFAPAGSVLGSDSLVVTRSAPVAGLKAISTLGTIDWLLLNGSTGIPRTVSGFHAKVRGGALLLGFDWVLSGGNPFSQANGDAITWTTILADDRASAPLTAANTGTGIFVTAGAKYGWMLSGLPASKLTRHLVIYAESFSCDTELIVELHGQVVTAIPNTYAGTINARRGDIFTIDYAAPQGGELRVSYLLKTVLGSNLGPNVKFNYAYIF